jgi:putative (di)nucleoside polyphosphate hydrolase
LSSEFYYFDMKQYRSAVSVLVVRKSDDPVGEQSVLLVHKPRTRDAWQLPQGGIEEGETFEQAALRELKEEAGLSMKSVDFVSKQIYRYDFPQEFIERQHPFNDGQRLHFVVVEAAGDEMVSVDHHEVDDALWVTVDQLASYVDRKEYLDIVKSVFKEYLTAKGR